MKATGIVRRIDDLGRVVIPKEIRRTMRIREGDPLEIYTDREGEVIFKKYSPIGELATFAGQYAGKDQIVLYITERCVFQLIDHKVTLIEIAPGIDLEKDILANMDFKPEISPDLKLMDAEIFNETWGGLAKYVEK